MTKKILVVDDNQVLLKFVRNLLEREGHEVQTAGNGLEALHLIPVFLPDILIADLVMPKIDGDRLCRTVRKMDGMQNCRIIVLSAALAEIEFELADICADAYIAKSPFPQMARHILEALAMVATQTGKDKNQKIIGRESVHARRMTRELLRRNQHLNAILDSMVEEIVETCDGRIVYANPAAIQFFGLPEEKLLAADPAGLLGPKVRSRFRTLLAKNGKTVSTIGQRAPIPINERFVTIKRLPIRDGDNTCIMCIGDATERSQLEMQLHHSQKMEAIGTIASGVVHNFRNTLSTIKMNNELLQLNRTDDPELLEVTRRIQTSIKHATDLVEGLMDFCRKQVRKEMNDIDMVEVINQIYQIIRASFDPCIHIKLDVPESLPMRGDCSGLSLALLNLCTNARDAMPEGGTLTISARADGGVVEVRIADTGIGMKRETLKNCFTAFFTTKHAGQGTGLGLSTTYSIIESHYGEVSVSSAPGKGTIFFLRLPMAAAMDNETDRAGEDARLR